MRALVAARLAPSVLARELVKKLVLYARVIPTARVLLLIVHCAQFLLGACEFVPFSGFALE